MRRGFLILALAMAAFLAAALCIAEEIQVSPVSVEPAEQWLWGEVTLVKPGDRTITVKYADAETDKDMKMTFSVDDNTKFENVNSFDEIKPGDSVSFTYISAAEGKNIAKTVNLEKIDEAPAASGSPVEEVFGEQQLDMPVSSTTPDITQEQAPVLEQQAISNSVDSGK
ncbi:MAG: hypothetical protein WCY12_00100 [Candidatus Omnitrophota bacterium]